MPARDRIETVAVFCASADGTNPAYRSEAEALGHGLAARGIGLVYGGAAVGLMRAVADATLVAGGKVVGVIPEVLVDLEVAHGGLTELHVTSTMHTRKELMGKRSDAFVVLPGGFGTMEELFEVLAWQTLKLHDKPIVLLNTLGFYDTLLAFLDHSLGEGMMSRKKRDIVLVANGVDEVFSLLGI